MTAHDIELFIANQLQSWSIARTNHQALLTASVTTVDTGGYPFTIHVLPERARSNNADISSAAIASRPCFLCEANRPAEQHPRHVCGFDMLVNPYPILPGHLTIVSPEHTPQSITGSVERMAQIARELEEYTIFYNGPECGASAPDHLHFQAVPTAGIPLWQNMDKVFWTHIHLTDTPAGVCADIRSWLRAMPSTPSSEPKVNVIMRYIHTSQTLEAVIFPRLRHRPSAYGKILVSPGALDMCGILVTPRAADVALLTPDCIATIFSEVSLPASILPPKPVPMISVGILKAPTISITDTTRQLHTLTYGADTCFAAPASAAASITIHDVVIGKEFHWQQLQDQLFKGLIHIRPAGDGTNLEAIDYIDVESYLTSVISSEMSADAPTEFLKAHAVISRSWVLSQMQSMADPTPPPGDISPEERIMWYDRQNHRSFHVCADDHCQRYQGFSRAFTPAVEEALHATRGLVLTSDGAICDARFSKCCGGATEIFSTCWQNNDYPYLTAVADTDDAAPLPDLTDETQAHSWILSHPASFCGDASPEMLARALNGYDQTTTDYYRWSINYTANELKRLITARTGITLGDITAIRALRRGPSGRIMRLLIEGTRSHIIIGKELEIRRALSPTHLYSSAFIAEPHFDTSDTAIPASWTIRGAGWGHGVGLCQIGAARMATCGYSFSQILSHYYPGASLTRLY